MAWGFQKNYYSLRAAKLWPVKVGGLKKNCLGRIKPLLTKLIQLHSSREEMLTFSDLQP